MRDTGQTVLGREWVTLTQGELAERGRQLADLLHTRDRVVEDQAERKKAMRAEVKEIDGHIRELAEAVRMGREERPVARDV
jgi:hypothetical protein